MAPAQVVGIIEQLAIVGAAIKSNRQGFVGSDAAHGTVEGEFADADTHTTNALITQTKDTLTVGDDNHLNVTFEVGQHGTDVLTLGISNIDSPWAAVEVAETLAGLANHRRVDDWQHLLQVALQKGVEQCFVGILQGAQVDMLENRCLLDGERFVGPPALLFHGLYPGGQEAVQLQFTAFFHGKRGPFVQ